MSDIRVDSANATLAVTQSEGDRGAIVALHGASEGVRSYELYKHLHRALGAIDVSVVTFDRRGEGDSSGEPSRGDLELQVRDCLEVVRALEITRVGLWGFSQGAWVAVLASSRLNQMPCLVTIAATGVTPAEQMRYGVARHLSDAGYGTDVAATVDKLRVDVGDAMRGRCADELELAHRLEEARREPWWPLAYLRDSLPGPEARAAWVREMDFDPAPSFAAVSCPALCFYGSRDEWSPVQKNTEVWRAASDVDVEICVLEGLGHAPIREDGGVDLNYERTLVEWVDQRFDHPTSAISPRP